MKTVVIKLNVTPPLWSSLEVPRIGHVIAALVDRYRIAKIIADRRTLEVEVGVPANDFTPQAIERLGDEIKATADEAARRPDQPTTVNIAKVEVQAIDPDAFAREIVEKAKGKRPQPEGGF